MVLEGGWNVCRLVLLVAVDAPAARRAFVACRKLQDLKVPVSMDSKRTVTSDSWRPHPSPARKLTMFHVKRARPAHHRKYVTDAGDREPCTAAEIEAPMVVPGASSWGAPGVTGSTGALSSATAVGRASQNPGRYRTSELQEARDPNVRGRRRRPCFT